VFDVLADPRNEERWNPNAVRVDLLSAGPPGVGTRFAGRYRRGGRMTFEISRFERPSLLVFRGGGSRVRLVATVRVNERADGTAVSMAADMRPRGPLRALAPLMRPAVERQYADVAGRLRAFIETEGGR
jgi:hypothetical protein